MKATDTERIIINALGRCRFMAGSFDKKFGRDLNPENISPLQKYYIYKIGYKYRKQIKDRSIEIICANYIANNREPLSRKEAERLLKQALKSKDPESGAEESNQLNLGL